tara:strand:+ start:1936 stop:2076 length:141 start_codon:yes stop_codon:yes gene_type:complete
MEIMDSKKSKVKKVKPSIEESRIQEIEESIAYLQNKLDKVLVRMGL